jgi:hypothetical protein
LKILAQLLKNKTLKQNMVGSDFTIAGFADLRIVRTHTSIKEPPTMQEESKKKPRLKRGNTVNKMKNPKLPLPPDQVSTAPNRNVALKMKTVLCVLNSVCLPRKINMKNRELTS